MKKLILQDEFSRKFKSIVLVFSFLLCFYIVYSNEYVLNKNVVIAGAITLITAFLLITSSLRMFLTDDNIEIKFLFITKKIALSEIKDISTEQGSALKKFGGFGIRYNLKGELGYVLNSNNLMRIQTHKGQIIYVTYREYNRNSVNEFILKFGRVN